MWQGLEIKPSLEHPLGESRLLDEGKDKSYIILLFWHNGELIIMVCWKTILT